jgi:transcriptional regulator with PAS, ATPase and Fis domain
MGRKPQSYSRAYVAKSSYEYAHREKKTNIQDTEEIIEESLSLERRKKNLLQKALQKHGGKRKYAAQDLGIF